MRRLTIIGASFVLLATRAHAQDSTALAVPSLELGQHTGFAVGATFGAVSGRGEAYEFTDPGYEIQGYVAITWQSPDQIRLGLSFARHNDKLDSATPFIVVTGSAEVFWAVTGDRWKLLAGPALTFGRTSGAELRDLSGWGAGLVLAAQWSPTDNLALELGWTLRSVLYARPDGSMDPDGVAPGTARVLRLGALWRFPAPRREGVRVSAEERTLPPAPRTRTSNEGWAAPGTQPHREGR